MAVDAVIEIEERDGVIFIHEEIAGMGILVDHAEPVRPTWQAAQMGEDLPVFCKGRMLARRHLAFHGLIDRIVPDVALPGRVGGKVGLCQGMHPAKQATVCVEEFIVKLLLRNLRARSPDEGRTEEFIPLTILDRFDQVPVL